MARPDLKGLAQLALVLGLALPATSCAKTFAPFAGTAHKSNVRSDDLLVIGRIENLNSESLDDFGMSLRVLARLSITHVVRGHSSAPVLTFYYVAHSELQEDRDLRFHLRKSKDGTWFACSERSGQGYVCR